MNAKKSIIVAAIVASPFLITNVAIAGDSDLPDTNYGHLFDQDVELVQDSNGNFDAGVLCRSYLNQAKNIMGARQNGNSMIAILKIVKSDKLLSEMTKTAYKYPGVYGKMYKLIAIRTFADSVYSDCKNHFMNSDEYTTVQDEQ